MERTVLDNIADTGHFSAFYWLVATLIFEAVALVRVVPTIVLVTTQSNDLALLNSLRAGVASTITIRQPSLWRSFEGNRGVEFETRKGMT